MIPFSTLSVPQTIAEKATKSKGKSKALPAPDDGPSNTAPDSAGAEDSSAVQELMKALHVADLKTWIDSHKISTMLKNKKGMSSISSEHVL